ncbi:cupin domain-containing protein [Paenibacillus sp. FSL K6-1217]|uniref:cupin domain-containing protein n=1 Tax=Paenibacillus sp. FSL K6-1217 TaxID=2921466 RepID=UPI003256310E
MLDPVLQAPDLKLAADSNQVLNYKRDANNYITQLFAEQLPAIRNGFFNAHMSKGFIVQPHWHTNVTEMIFVISGELIASVFDPFTQKLMTYHLKAGQIAVFPKGWFHWILAESEQAHFLAIFDAPTPDIVYGSDFLRAVPAEVIQRAYCINEEEYAKAVAPLKESIILGPPPGCATVGASENSYPAANAQQMSNAAMPEGMYMSAAKSMPAYTAQQPAAAFYPYPMYPRR